MRITNSVAVIVFLSAISGCAAPPNTPGAGIGKDYTPVIDTHGADTSRYSGDLAACRKYAGYVDAEGSAMAGMIAGMVVAGALSAALGGRYQDNVNNATLGGAYGLSSEANKATSKQERIMINCMAGRGYRTLDGGQISPIAYTPPTAQPAAAVQGPKPSPVPIIPTDTPRPDLSPADQVALGAAIATPTATAPAGPAGQFSYQAERLAEVKACNAIPSAKLAGKGPGVENYTVACSNGDFLSVRCEFSNCRVLK
jgi:hypothetical protein